MNLQKSERTSCQQLQLRLTEAGIARPTLDDKETPGRLQPIASKVLMKILFAARMARPDLLRATQSLASRVTKWSIECDIALHRLVAYVHSSTKVFMKALLGIRLTTVNCGFSQMLTMQGNLIQNQHLVVLCSWWGLTHTFLERFQQETDSCCKLFHRSRSRLSQSCPSR